LEEVRRILTGSQSQSPKTIENNVRSISQNLIKLAEANSELFFKDQYGKPYAKILINDHYEIIGIEDSKFKHLLSKMFYEQSHGKVACQESLNDALRILQAKTIFGDQTIPLNLRVAWKDHKIYYDMTDDKRRCIMITEEEWRIIESHAAAPTLFKRHNQKSQVEPTRDYEPDVFDKFLELTNIKDHQHKVLLKTYIVSLFVPEIQHAILLLHGDPGSAKTTLYRMIKLLVDPSKAQLLTLHNDRSEFIQQLSHNHVAFYDNVKHVPEWLSDEACKAVTGIGHTKRKLYTDDEDIVYEYMRCLGFNGINVSLVEPDALDRSILIDVTRIPKEKVKEKSEIMAEFEELLPKLLGYLLDIIVKAMQIRPTIKLNDLPRMADFAKWCEAISRAMGYENMEFINAYYKNIGKQNIEVIEAHPLGSGVTKLVEELENEAKLPWEGSPTNLLDLLDSTVTDRVKHQRLWPKSANALVRRLNTIKTNLLEGLGISVTISRITTGNKKNTSIIRIEKIAPLPPLSPPTQIH
jgi:hypothetical protein